MHLKWGILAVTSSFQFSGKHEAMHSCTARGSQLQHPMNSSSLGSGVQHAQERFSEPASDFGKNKTVWPENEDVLSKTQKAAVCSIKMVNNNNICFRWLLLFLITLTAIVYIAPACSYCQLAKPKWDENGRSWGWLCFLLTDLFPGVPSEMHCSDQRCKGLTCCPDPLTKQSGQEAGAF